MKKKSKFNLKTLIICLIIVFGVAFIGSLFTSGNTNSDWYDSIRPSITPPNYVFPIVWNILFFLIAMSLYLAWRSSNKIEKRNIAIVFGINFFLNVFWSVLYFQLQNPFLAFFEIIILIISILSMIYVTWGINKVSSYLLIPYLVWVCFASVLNWMSI